MSEKEKDVTMYRRIHADSHAADAAMQKLLSELYETANTPRAKQATFDLVCQVYPLFFGSEGLWAKIYSSQFSSLFNHLKLDQEARQEAHRAVLRIHHHMNRLDELKHSNLTQQQRYAVAHHANEALENWRRYLKWLDRWITSLG